MEVYFKDKLTRAEFKMGTMMTMTTVSNETTGDVLMLMSGMMGQTAIKSNSNETAKDTVLNKNPNVDVTLTNETKVIEGYNCKKGTAGVGKAANAAVVYTSMLLFIIDFVAVFVTNIFYDL